MTAIVGILNRRGLAFAADSAATHKSKSGLKISNNANKLFSLSNYHPVGVALYNNLDFIGVPWDSIIKRFRDNQKEKSFDTLKGYVKPFFDFVKTYCLTNFLEQQKSFLIHIANNLCNEIESIVEKEIGGFTIENSSLFFQQMISKMDDYYSERIKDKAEDFKDYKKEDFVLYSYDIIDLAISKYYSSPNYPAEFKDKFLDALFAVICHNSHRYLEMIYSGLVFFGYGDKDLFPSLVEYRVTYAIDNRIKYTFKLQYEVGPAPGDAVIAPFAQTDVSNTVVRAVEDKLRQKFYDNFNTAINGFRDEIIVSLTKSNAPSGFVDIFKNLNVEKYTTDYCKGMDNYIDQSYIKPLMDTVAYLDKEDLADMAESLVRMTCLKRHVTTDDETVGGPVDVAIVTKGDGFIWKKRKHYFDPDLNFHFFERYKN